MDGLTVISFVPGGELVLSIFASLMAFFSGVGNHPPDDVHDSDPPADPAAAEKQVRFVRFDSVDIATSFVYG